MCWSMTPSSIGNSSWPVCVVVVVVVVAAAAAAVLGKGHKNEVRSSLSSIWNSS